MRSVSHAAGSTDERAAANPRIPAFLEQPACLHANMDVYKWAYKLLPLVDSTLVMDCFDLAWDARELDMRAAPYDIRDWGVRTDSGGDHRG